MSTEKNTVSHSGISVCSLLGILFVALKLCGQIHWSWLWVLAPFWVPLVLILVFIGLGVGGILLLYAIDRVSTRNRTSKSRLNRKP